MVNDQLKQGIMLMFQARDFEGMWYAIKDEYHDLGFTDDLPDQVRIDEYKWITQQLRKYMFTKQDDIMKCDSVEAMVTMVDDLIGKAEEYGDERKKIVYNFMRDHWLYEVRNHLMNLIERINMQKELDDEREDEYA